MERKLNRARGLLAETEMPIADIAAYCGYGASLTFTAAFKQQFGMRPSEIRKAADRD